MGTVQTIHPVPGTTNEAAPAALPVGRIVPAEVAVREGWDLFDVDSNGLLEIERDDAAEVFKSDVDAIAYVRERAAQGSLVHCAAIAVHDRDADALNRYRGI